MPTAEEILRKYSKKIGDKIEPNSLGKKGFSKEYSKFRKEMVPELTRYERWANTLGNLIKIKGSKKDEKKVGKALEIAHLEVTPGQALTLAVVSLLIAFFITLLSITAIYLITGTFQLLLGFLGLLVSLFIFYYTYSMPQRLANSWRLKASSQMVPAILYIVVYMKHTSNLERAIQFASQHLEGPLALDFRKIFYNVEIGKFSSIKQSINNYLGTWSDYSPEFVESVHLIESSLYEPIEGRRIQILEKSLQIILDGVYEKMLAYTREIKGPLTNLYMLGIILPTLGLALLPLASALMGGIIQWQHIMIIFNVLIPFLVFYMTTEVLLKRPGGHGEASIAELNPDYNKFNSKKPWVIASFIAIPLLIIGLLPFIFQIGFLTSPFGLENDYTFKQIGIGFNENIANTKIFDFKEVDGSLIGPFGPGSIFLSLFIPLSIAVFFSTAYKRKTKDLIVSRNHTKALEKEFANSIFQLGNRLGDGTPAEIAFSKVAHSTQGLKTQKFFSLVNQNIQQLGMTLEEAIFNPKRGAIIYYPSALISTSMRILVESVKKGLKVAARSLMSISEYIKNIQKINNRLKDLLAEVVSDMKSNMVFLAPLLAGIVVGLSAMISSILNQLQALAIAGQGDSQIAGLGSVANIMQIFDITKIIPPYFIQVTIGIYIVEIIFILTAALVTVDSGKDKLKEKYELSKNLRRGILIYLGTAFISTLVLTVLSAIALQGIT
jgi:Flp pilus assembly protein TadB